MYSRDGEARIPNKVGRIHSLAADVYIDHRAIKSSTAVEGSSYMGLLLVCTLLT